MINPTRQNFVTQKYLFSTNFNPNKKVQDDSKYNVPNNKFSVPKSKQISFCGLNSGDILRSIYLKLNLSVSQITMFEKEATQRTTIPLSGKSFEKGLNQVVGLDRLKRGVYDDILTPLLLFSEHTQLPRLNGVMFFGPKGTGKTYFANQMGEHFVSKGGQFEELRFSGNPVTDIQYLETKFQEAQTKFKQSERKKYTIFFIDEIEKKFARDNDEQIAVLNKLLSLTQNCNSNGVVLVSTANYLDKVDPALLIPGSTDMLIPMDYVDNNDFASLVRYYIEKNQLPVASNIDIDIISREVSEREYKYKPKDIEKALIDEAKDIVDYGGELNNKSLRRILVGNRPQLESAEYEQFKRDEEHAKSLGIFYNYTEDAESSDDFKLALIRKQRKLLKLEKCKQKFEERVTDLKNKLLQISITTNSVE